MLGSHIPKLLPSPLQTFEHHPCLCVYCVDPLCTFFSLQDDYITSDLYLHFLHGPISHIIDIGMQSTLTISSICTVGHELYLYNGCLFPGRHSIELCARKTLNPTSNSTFWLLRAEIVINDPNTIRGIAWNIKQV